MGYRSDVCLCLKKDVLKGYSTRYATDRAREIKTIGELLEESSHYTDPATGDDLWLWENIKWYPDYQDISSMEFMLAELDRDEYLFIRIGEDSEDNEVSGTYWDNPFDLYLERNIHFERPQNGNR